MVVFLLCIIIWLIATKDCCKKDSGYSGYRDYSLGPTPEEYEEMFNPPKKSAKEIKERRIYFACCFFIYWIARFFGFIPSFDIVHILDVMVGTYTLILIIILFDKIED